MACARPSDGRERLGVQSLSGRCGRRRQTRQTTERRPHGSGWSKRYPSGRAAEGDATMLLGSWLLTMLFAVWVVSVPVCARKALPPVRDGEFDWTFYLHAHPQLFMEGAWDESAVEKAANSDGAPHDHRHATTTPKHFCSHPEHRTPADCAARLHVHELGATGDSCIFGSAMDLMRIRQAGWGCEEHSSCTEEVRVEMHEHYHRLWHLLDDHIDYLLPFLDNRHIASIVISMAQGTSSETERAQAGFLHQHLMLEKFWASVAHPGKKIKKRKERLKGNKQRENFSHIDIHYEPGSLHAGTSVMRAYFDSPRMILSGHPFLWKLYKSYVAWTLVEKEYTMAGYAMQKKEGKYDKDLMKCLFEDGYSSSSGGGCHSNLYAEPTDDSEAEHHNQHRGDTLYSILQDL